MYYAYLLLLDVAGFLYAFRKVYVAEVEIIGVRTHTMMTQCQRKRGDWLMRGRFRHYGRNV